MKALGFLAVFIGVSIIATVAFVTAAFIFWSFASVQPGTATALGTLFLAAPAAGVVTGLFTAARAVRPRPEGEIEPSGRRWLKTGFAAAIGFLFGYGGSRATIDLVYVDRFSDPASAPAWLPVMPAVAGIGAAMVLALVVALGRSRT